MTRACHRLLAGVAAAGAVLVLAVPAVATRPAASAQPATPTPTEPLTVSTLSIPAGQSAVVVVLDASGSMSEDDGTGTVKIAGAKTALLDFARAVPEDVDVGLRVYPGGELDDEGCERGTLRSGIRTRTLLDAEIRAVEPDGDTPTAAALLAGADDLRAVGYAQGTLVLVSDGEFTCGQDPCEAARTLEQAGIDVTVNTVGFRISDAGRSSLECVAAATGGVYRDVQDSEDLTRQLGELSKPLLTIAPLIFPDPVIAVSGQARDGLIDITARIGSVGVAPALDVRAALTFQGEIMPAVPRPRRRLGNLAPGGEREVTWQVRPPLERQKQRLSFTVSASSTGRKPVTQTGSLELDPRVSLADAGPLLANARRVAILGDSYSSGEGAGDYDPETGTRTNGCHRSRRTYGVELFTQAGAQVDVLACSGAVAADLVVGNPDRSLPDGTVEPPQVQQLARGPYDLVLMTLGGNDIGFAPVITQCAITDHFPGRRCPQDLLAPVARDLEGLPAMLLATYEAVDRALNGKGRAAARGAVAPIVVLAYPNVVPASARSCGALFDAEELRFFRLLTSTLNEQVAYAVNLARSRGLPVYYVADTQDATQPDHTYCDRDPWVHRLSPAATVAKLTDTVLYSKATATVPTPVRPASVGYRTVLRAADALQPELPPGQVPSEVAKFAEQFHPTSDGYRSETVRLVRWSTGIGARTVPVADKGLPIGVANPFPLQALRPGTTRVLAPGAGIEVQGSDWLPGSPVLLELQSQPMVSGKSTADDAGVVSIRGWVPTTLPLGHHRAVLRGTGRDGDPREQTFSLRVVARPDPAVPGLAAVAVLSALGAAWLRVRRGAWSGWR